MEPEIHSNFILARGEISDDGGNPPARMGFLISETLCSNPMIQRGGPFQLSWTKWENFHGQD